MRISDWSSDVCSSDLADPSAGLYPVARNERYSVDQPITDEGLATTYNNYYEFGSSKTIAKKAQALPIRPWTVAIGGMVEQPTEIDIDELLAKMPLEERVYRHRCVDARSEEQTAELQSPMRTS